jgi:hypothetical protein
MPMLSICQVQIQKDSWTIVLWIDFEFWIELTTTMNYKMYILFSSLTPSMNSEFGSDEKLQLDW